MKIVGGTFGVSGTAWLTDGGDLHLDCVRTRDYRRADVTKVVASVSKERKFRAVSFALGALLLGLLGAFFAGPLGVLIGIVLAIAGSFSSESTNRAEVGFADSESVTLECSASEVERLVALRA